MTVMRVISLAIVLLLCSSLGRAAGSVSGEGAYPLRPVRLVVPQAPGGTTDALARMLSDQLERRLSVPVIVDNRPGANGVIGNDVAKRSNADGHTLLVGTTATHVMTPHVIAGLTHDVLRDFVPVVNLVYQTKVVLVNASLGVRTMQDFITLAKSRPGQLNYASAGTGSSSHLDTEYLAHLTGLRLVHIPYRGSRQTTLAVSTNEVQLLLASVTSAQAALASGGARALAVLSDRRSPLMPDVPTLVEAGLPRLDVKTWIGLFAPYGTPVPILDMLNQMVNDLVRKPEARAWFDRQGLEPGGGLRAAFDGEVRADYQRWGRLVRELGLGPR